MRYQWVRYPPRLALSVVQCPNSTTQKKSNLLIPFSLELEGRVKKCTSNLFFLGKIILHHPGKRRDRYRPWYPLIHSVFYVAGKNSYIHKMRLQLTFGSLQNPLFGFLLSLVENYLQGVWTIFSGSESEVPFAYKRNFVMILVQNFTFYNLACSVFYTTPYPTASPSNLPVDK